MAVVEQWKGPRSFVAARPRCGRRRQGPAHRERRAAPASGMTHIFNTVRRLPEKVVAQLGREDPGRGRLGFPLFF